MKHNPSQLIENAVLETLETRQMMSATLGDSATLLDGVLTVNGDATQPTNMVVDYSPDRSSVLVHDGSLNESFSGDAVDKLVINGGTGADNIVVSDRITLPTEIHGNGGDDVIHGGGGNDTIYAGDGNVLVYGGRGDNLIYGGAGNDTLLGQDGNDTIHAGSGDDFIDGGGGNDSLIAGAGDDTLIGGSGNDTLVGGSGTDVELGQSGDDVLSGNSASTLLGGAGRNTINGIASGASASHGSTPVVGSVDSSSPSTNNSASSGDGASSTGSGSTAPPAATPVSTPVTVAPVAPVTKPVSTPVTPVTPASTVPTAVITTLAGVRQTGLAVNVDALSSTFGAGTAITSHYAWNFGDTGSYGDTLSGWNAAHVYDNPGSYTISLTVTNSLGQTNTTTSEVTIAASTRKIIYVDSVSGSDDNAGTEDAPLQSLAAVFSDFTDNTEVLLKAGESFDVTASLHIANSNIVIGRYGTGADPVMNRISGGGTSTLALWTNCQGVTVQNITFDSPYAVAAGDQAPKIGVSGVFAGGYNIAVRDCTFLNLDDAVNCNSSPTGMLVQNNTAPLATGLRGYFVWGQGSLGVYDGNTVANSTREHIIRMVDETEVTVEDNNLTNLNRQSIDPYDFSKGCIEEHRGSYAFITGNTVADGDIRVGPLGIDEAATTSTENSVIEDNQLTDTVISIDSGAHHIMIDDNVITNINGTAIIVQAPDSQGRTVQDVTITNNTAVNTGTSGNFLQLLGPATGLTLTHNLWVAPHVEPGVYNSGAVYAATPDLSSFTLIADNIWPTPANASPYADGGICLVGATATSTGYVTPAQWNALPQVQDDQFQDVTLSDTYQMTLNDILAGSSQKLAA